MGYLNAFVIILMGLLVLTSCATTTTAPAPVIPEEKEVVVTEGLALSGLEKEWNKILLGAKKEGKVVLGTSGGAELRIALTEAFQKSYPDITLVTESGKAAMLAEKAITEQRAGLYLKDVFITRVTTLTNVMHPAGILVPLKPTIRPDIIDPKNWLPGHPFWSDKDRQIVAIENSASGGSIANTNMVKPDELKSFRELLNPKWKGRFVMINPTVTKETFYGAIGLKYGWDFWREFARQEPVLLVDERLIVQWVAQGKYAIGLTAKTEITWEFIKAGAPLRSFLFDDASYVSGDATAILKNPPHPNAAKVFVNWLLSQEGQWAYHNAQGSWSARPDVNATLNSDPEKKPKPGVDYFNGFDYDFIMGQREREKILGEIFAPFIR